MGLRGLIYILLTKYSKAILLIKASPKPKSSFLHLKRDIQDFHMNSVLVPADKAANNVVVV